MLLRFLVLADARHLKRAALDQQPMAGVHQELVRLEQALRERGDGLDVADWMLVSQGEDDDK